MLIVSACIPFSVLQAKDVSTLYIKTNPDHGIVKKILEDFTIAFDIAAALIKPRTGICEQYLEKRPPMKQLKNRPEVVVLQYFCARYKSCYSKILSRISLEYNQADNDEIILMILEEQEEEGEVTDLKNQLDDFLKSKNTSGRRFSQGSAFSGVTPAGKKELKVCCAPTSLSVSH
jgi:hypothetical protein